MINNSHDKKDMGKFSRNVPMLVAYWVNNRDNYLLGCNRAPAVESLGFSSNAKIGSSTSQLAPHFAQANLLQSTTACGKNRKDLGYDLN